MSLELSIQPFSKAISSGTLTGRLPSTAFVVQPTKDGSNQQYNQPLSLKFSNAGTVDGKSVDVYVTINSLDLTLKNANADYNNPNKTDVAFLTVDENWGTKSFQIMDYIDVNHPSYTADMFRSYAINANVTVELKYTDGTPCNLKLVMQPSDIDVVGDTGANETFSPFFSPFLSPSFSLSAPKS